MLIMMLIYNIEVMLMTIFISKFVIMKYIFCFIRRRNTEEEYVKMKIAFYCAEKLSLNSLRHIFSGGQLFRK